MNVSRQSEWQVSRRAWRREWWRLFRGELIRMMMSGVFASLTAIGGVICVAAIGGVICVALVAGLVLLFSYSIWDWLREPLMWFVLAPIGVVAVSAIPIAAWIGFWTPLREELDRARTSALDGLNLLDDDLPPMLVDVQYTDGEAVAGRDSGILWMEDNRLHFVGRYSDFSLTPFELQRWSEAPRVVQFGPQAVVIHLRESGLIGHRKIVVNSTAKHPWPNPAEEVRRFEQLPVTEERGQLPPIGVGPDGSAIRLTWRQWVPLRCWKRSGPRPTPRELAERLVEFLTGLGFLVWITGMLYPTPWVGLGVLVCFIYCLVFWHPSAHDWIGSWVHFRRLRRADRRRLAQLKRDALGEAPYRKLGTSESEK